MWNREDLAWAAGLFEGEGFVGPHDYRKHRPAWMMAVVMTDEDVVRRFHRIVGVGTVCGPAKPRAEGHLPTWRWQVASRKYIYALCVALWPFMGRRRQERMTQAIQELPPVGRTRRKL